MNKTYVKIGWAKPKAANWSYGIWLIHDETGSKLYRETFGGVYTMEKALIAKGIAIKYTVVSELARYGVRQATRLPDIEEYRGRNY